MAEQLKKLNAEILEVEATVQAVMKNGQFNARLPFQVG